jgi:acyl-CoA thioesterase-2
MPECTEPDLLISELELRRRFQHMIPEKVRDAFIQDRPIDIRPVRPMNYGQPDIRPPSKQNWFRAVGTVPARVELHHALLAYTSDFGLLGTSLQPHGVCFADRSMQVASLDHAIWFHREFDIGDWLLYDMDSPSASGGRGFNRGNIFNQKGELVASVTQEALIRRRP